jgi:hypothetical protein
MQRTLLEKKRDRCRHVPTLPAYGKKLRNVLANICRTLRGITVAEVEYFQLHTVFCRAN